MRFCITVYGFLAYTIARALPTSMGAQGACAVLLAYWSALDRLGANDPDPDCALHILRSRPPAVVLVQWRCASTPRRFSTLRMSGNGDKTVIFSRRADDIRPGENRAEEAVDGGYVHCMRRSGKFWRHRRPRSPTNRPRKSGKSWRHQSPRSPANRPRKRSAGRLHVRRSRRPLQSPANSYTARTVCAVPAHTHRVAAGARVMPPRGSGRRRKMDERRCVNLGRPHKCLEPIRRRLASCSGASLDGGPY